MESKNIVSKTMQMDQNLTSNLPAYKFNAMKKLFNPTDAKQELQFMGNTNSFVKKCTINQKSNTDGNLAQGDSVCTANIAHSETLFAKKISPGDCKDFDMEKQANGAGKNRSANPGVEKMNEFINNITQKQTKKFNEVKKTSGKPFSHIPSPEEPKTPKLWSHSDAQKFYETEI